MLPMNLGLIRAESANGDNATTKQTNPCPPARPSRLSNSRSEGCKESSGKRKWSARYTKEGSQHLFQKRQEVFRFIKENAALFSVEKMCKVSSSGYYYWRKHPVGARQQNQNQLEAHIRRVHAQSQGRYGSPRIAEEIHEQGVKASRNRIASLMQKTSIRSIIYKKYRVQTTDSNHDYPVAKNLLNREFLAYKLGQKWVSDITYITTKEGWL